MDDSEIDELAETGKVESSDDEALDDIEPYKAPPMSTGLKLLIGCLVVFGGLVVLLLSLRGVTKVAAILNPSNKTKITRDMKTIYNTAKIIYATSGSWPESIDEMVDRTDDDGNDLEGLDEMPKDPWGGEYEYKRIDGKLVITCLGRDGRAGGEGDDQDYQYLGGKLYYKRPSLP